MAALGGYAGIGKINLGAIFLRFNNHLTAAQPHFANLDKTACLTPARLSRVSRVPSGFVYREKGRHCA